MSLFDDIRAELHAVDERVADHYADDQVADQIDTALELLDDLHRLVDIATDAASAHGETRRQLRVSHAHRAHLRGVLRDIAQAQTVEMARRRAEQALGAEPPVSLIEREELGRVARGAHMPTVSRYTTPGNASLPDDEYERIAEAVARYVRDVDAAGREGAR
jgi:hypothetical protein